MISSQFEHLALWKLSRRSCPWGLCPGYFLFLECSSPSELTAVILFGWYLLHEASLYYNVFTDHLFQHGHPHEAHPTPPMYSRFPILLHLFCFPGHFALSHIGLLFMACLFPVERLKAPCYLKPGHLQSHQEDRTNLEQTLPSSPGFRAPVWELKHLFLRFPSWVTAFGSPFLWLSASRAGSPTVVRNNK